MKKKHPIKMLSSCVGVNPPQEAPPPLHQVGVVPQGAIAVVIATFVLFVLLLVSYAKCLPGAPPNPTSHSSRRALQGGSGAGAGGAGGGGGEWPPRGLVPREDLMDQLAVTVMRLQQDLNTVNARLQAIESADQTQVGFISTHIHWP